ncbi:hypothetical protein DY000_02037185 [Brassica cretica]|uniref:Prohibitin n=1 Tax=Brassica cretica TaxID=69181 RepID=A0ABQ7B8U0_BRACR|nr:hypothetical protein DY000_02037185 [Brassica cretica]
MSWGSTNSAMIHQERVTRASTMGEAKSAQLIGQAIANNQAFITLRKIEAAREIAQTIAHSANKVYLSSDDLLLNLQEMNLDVNPKK